MYRTILIDPPWPIGLVGKFDKHKNRRPAEFPYPVLTLDQIRSLPIPALADKDCHLWLWTTNATLGHGLDMMKAWGFKYFCPVHWIKPSGIGAWWIHRSQTLLFGYQGKLDMKTRYKPNILEANPGRHSQKPEASYALIEEVSHGPRLELFARGEKRTSWHQWGNECNCDLEIELA